MKFDAPEEIGGGNFLKAPGTYHLHVIQVLEDQYADGKLIEGGGFNVALDCLDGTVREENKCTEVCKTLNLTFYNGKFTDKDKGLFAREKQAAFLVSANVITPDQLGKSIDVDLQKAVGHSVVMALELNKEGYLRLERSACYHVDDPRVSGVPKDEKAMKLTAAEFRHPKEWFDGLMKKKAKPATNGGSGGGASSSGGNGGNGGGLSQKELDDL